MTNKLHSLYTVALIDVLKILTLSLIAYNKHLTTNNCNCDIFCVFVWRECVSIILCFFEDEGNFMGTKIL